jgi:catalase
MKAALSAARAEGKVVGPTLGELKGADGGKVPVDFSLLTASSVMFDAVYVPGGEGSTTALGAEPDAREFVSEAFRHCKAIGAEAEGVDFVRTCPGLDGPSGAAGLVLAESGEKGVAKSFIRAIAQHRHWSRATADGAPSPPPRRASQRKSRNKA